MADLTFYFDPLCPWAWRSSLWIREVQRQQPSLEVEWKFFSLAEANNFPDPTWKAPLQAAALARREGGNEAVGRAYLAMGQAIHESGVNVRESGVPTELISRKLAEAGFGADLLDRAVADPSTLTEMTDEHRNAVDKYKAYGVPWLIMAGNDIGFNTPVISEVPQGETALKLWEHLSWLLTQPYFYEMKRNR